MSDRSRSVAQGRLRPAGSGRGVVGVAGRQVVAAEVVLLVVLAAVVHPAAGFVVVAVLLVLAGAAAVVRPGGRSLVAARQARRSRAARVVRDRADPRVGSPLGPGGPRVREVTDRSGRPVAVVVHPAAPATEDGQGRVARRSARRVTRLPPGEQAGAVVPGPGADTVVRYGATRAVGVESVQEPAGSVAAVLAVASPEAAVRARRGEAAGVVTSDAARTTLGRASSVLRRRSGAPTAVQVLQVCSGAGAGRPADDAVSRSYAALTGGAPLVRRLFVVSRLDPVPGAAETARHGGGADGAVRAVAVTAARLEAELTAGGLVARVLDRPALARALDLATGVGANAGSEGTGTPPYEEQRDLLGWAGGWHACWVPRRLGQDPALVARLLDLVTTCAVTTTACSVELTAAGSGRVELSLVLRLVAPTRREVAAAGADLAVRAAAIGVGLVRADDDHGPLTAATLPVGGLVPEPRDIRSRQSAQAPGGTGRGTGHTPTPARVEAPGAASGPVALDPLGVPSGTR